MQVCRSTAWLANASLKGVSSTDVLSGSIFLHYAENNKALWGALPPHLPGSSALVLPALQAPRHSCHLSQGKVGGCRGFGISCRHCPQVTCKPEIQRLFPPSFIWQSPCLNHTCLADGLGGHGAKAGAVTAAWGHPQVLEVLRFLVPGQHLLLSPTHSGTC